MSKARIACKASKEEIRELVRSIPGILSGRIPDPTGGYVREIHLRIGMVALSLIKEAFLIKAKGGTDAAGLKWAPLAPSTIERRKQGPADKKAMTMKARLLALSPAERRRVKRDIKERTLKLQARGLTKEEATALARAQAFNVARSKGGDIPTRREILGGREVEILRDTGLLLNSLSPGLEGNILDATELGKVIIGTNDPKAEFHHKGGPNLPQRRLWPDVSTWPASWWDEIRNAARSGIILLIAKILRLRRFAQSGGSLPDNQDI